MKKWSIGAKIWFGFYILCNWLAFIEYATKPITAVNEVYQRATILYGISGAIATALILWMAIGHKKLALYIMLVLAGINAVLLLFNAGVMSALTSLIFPAVNWLIARNNVE
ncbi:MAG: hypothetical protein Q4E91_05855 [Lachnospiraceae bacterium]|nr:hypothetical protein [Lachnospiraceae bacterium]